MAFGHDSRSSLVRIRDEGGLNQGYRTSYIHNGLEPSIKNHPYRQVKMYKPTTPWAWAFMLTTTIQALNVLAIESYVFIKFQTSSQIKSAFNYNRSIPTFLTLFIFGFLYQLLLVYDSLRLKNTIQVIGLCIYNLGMLIYASIQFDQLRTALRQFSSTSDSIDPDHPIWRDIRPFLMVVPCIIATFTLIMSLIAWKLYDEFAWTIYKHISADLKMRRRFLTFQIYISLLKFDFFFFLGFTVQFVVIVSELKSTETALTIAAIPVTILILIMAGFWTRRENKIGMLLTIFLYFCGLAYFVFKLARMYQPVHEEKYLPARKSLTSFAVLTIILIILTILNASICTANFDMGLRPHLMKRRIGGEEAAEKDMMTELPEFPRGPVSNRMTID